MVGVELHMRHIALQRKEKDRTRNSSFVLLREQRLLFYAKNSYFELARAYAFDLRIEDKIRVRISKQVSIKIKPAVEADVKK